MGRKNQNTPITNRQDYNRWHMAKIKNDKLLKIKIKHIQWVPAETRINAYTYNIRVYAKT